MKNFSILLGLLLLLSILGVGCVRGTSGDDFFPSNQGFDFLLVVEDQIELRTSSTNQPIIVDGVNFVFRNEIVDPLPNPGFSSF